LESTVILCSVFQSFESDLQWAIKTEIEDYVNHKLHTLHIEWSDQWRDEIFAILAEICIAKKRDRIQVSQSNDIDFKTSKENTFLKVFLDKNTAMENGHLGKE